MEKVIDGILHFELNGEWYPYSSQHLTTMLLDARSKQQVIPPLLDKQINPHDVRIEEESDPPFNCEEP